MERTTMDEDEMVVLVNPADEPVGLARKSEVHTADTPLHRGFSAFVFDLEGRLLLQQRASGKVTWPRAWSNSVCGHPAMGESAEDAVRRRLAHELGLTEVALAMALPDFRYRAERDGIVENEVCPVLVGVTRQSPRPNPDEVEATRWVDWDTFVRSVRSGKAEVSPWCVEETLLLDALSGLDELLARLRAESEAAIRSLAQQGDAAPGTEGQTSPPGEVRDGGNGLY